MRSQDSGCGRDQRYNDRYNIVLRTSHLPLTAPSGKAGGDCLTAWQVIDFQEQVYENEGPGPTSGYSNELLNPSSCSLKRLYPEEPPERS